MNRFFTTLSLTPIFTVTQDDLYHQITRVFRAKKGEKVIFFNRGGGDVIYEISEITKNRIVFMRTEEISKNISEIHLNLHVFQAYPNKIATMEIIVQKLVEIGIKKLTFFPSAYSQLYDIGHQKRLRIENIAKEAMEQSGGNEPIEIVYDTRKGETILSQISPEIYHIVAHQKGNTYFDSKSISLKTVGLWIGPEGGWSEDESALFEEKGLSFWSFNQNILRLETAAILGAGILNYFGFHGK